MDFLVSKDIAPNYRDENVILYNEDCFKVLEGLPDNSIDLIVSDVPYHIVIGTRCSKNKGYPAKNQGKLFEYDSIKPSEYMQLLYDKLKDNSHIYLMINEKNLAHLQLEAEKVGFKFQQLIIWNKGNCIPNHYYLKCYEPIIMLRKGSAKDINNMNTKNIIDVPNIKAGTKVHPTEKPIELMKILIENSSNERDVVLDMFMGSGSTGVSALECNRKFIGCEIDKQYYDIAEDRIKNTLQTTRGI